VEVVVSGYREQADMILGGRADVAMLSSPVEAGGIETEPLYTEPRLAALPIGHPLAGRTELSCQDLAGEPIPRWHDESPAERRYWSGRDHDADGTDKS